MATVKRDFDPSLYPQFRTKSGLLTAYSFACGYIEEWTGKASECRIERDSACWHVKGSFPAIVGGIETRQFYWESFQYLKEARSFARKAANNGVPDEIIRK
jgi:hypothetical protein